MSTNPNVSWSRKPEMKLTPKRRLAKLISAKALSFFWISPSLLFSAIFLDHVLAAILSISTFG